MEIMYICLKPLVKWQEHEMLKKAAPEDSKRGSPKCVCIIDCFEVFVNAEEI